MESVGDVVAQSTPIASPTTTTSAAEGENTKHAVVADADSWSMRAHKGIFKDEDNARVNMCKDIEDGRVDRRVQLDTLPDEILEFILTYLPPYKDLECCRLVCKRWNAVVKNLVRRSKLNLHKGLLDYRLRWEVFTQHTATSVAQTQQQQQLAASPVLPIIAGRFSHSAVRYGNSMYVFGGGSSSDTTFNDLWRFDLSELRWDRPLSMGSYPSPKGSASIVCWREQLVLFGGWRYPSLHPPFQPWCLFDELHFYDLPSNRWTLRITLPSPPPMAGHSASVHGDRMIVFGGYQIADGINSNSNETWCLDLQALKWWQPRFVNSAKPPPRYGQFQLGLDDDHVLIVGGCGGPNSVYSDAWLLDMSRELWTWRAVPVRNKKYGATHMWCNPACKVGSKLVVLGPTPNMPQDFQLMKQMGAPHPQQARNNQHVAFERQRLVGGGPGAGAGIGAGAGFVIPLALPRAPAPQRLDNALGRAAGPDEQYFANRRAILQQHQQQANNNIFQQQQHNNNNNNNVQPRCGRLSELHAPAAPAAPALQPDERNQNRPSSSSRVNGQRNDNEQSNNGSSGSGNGARINGANVNDIEAANRLQRNLALRCRDNEPLLPKRFDELYEDPFRMAAFNVPTNRPRSVSKDHNERIRRMEEKMNALRNSRRSAMGAGGPRDVQKFIKEPSPKRIKRNVLSLFVCDLSAVLNADEPHLQWVEYKNYGVIPGAPERLILSTMVAGHGELILFGGVHKETLGEITHQVSNTVHFLSAPRDII